MRLPDDRAEVTGGARLLTGSVDGVIRLAPVTGITETVTANREAIADLLGMVFLPPTFISVCL